MTTVDTRLEEIAAMSPRELRGMWLQIFRAPAPELGHRLLALALSHKIQERRFGGLPPHIARHIGAAARNRDGADVPAPSLRPGTKLVRDWGGASHQVLVLDDGFLWQDERFGSLTQIARRITGVHWSGPRFFGLKRRKAREAAAA